MTYGILCNPGHNRVYFEASLKLSISEFCIVSRKLSVECENPQHEEICGVDYLTFQTKGELSVGDKRIISVLSFTYALFEIENIAGQVYLKPMDKNSMDFVDGGISSILKYTGKTNEIFTRMMINIAFYSQNKTDGIKLLDPLAGKGTTLYEGLVKGFDVFGIEIGESIINESYHFVKRFLEMARYKFEQSTMKISGPDKSFSALRHTFKTAKTKEDFKNKDTKTIEFIAGNSIYASAYFKKNYFDIIVADLPYGVQHGNVTKEKQSSLTRNPAELLKACLPAWTEVLRPGGIITLAWNSNVLAREKMEQLLEAQGLNVKKEEAYLSLEHRVDQSILRDVVVSVKF